MKIFLGAKGALLTNAKYMGPRANLRLSGLCTPNLDLYTSCSRSNPIHRTVAYSLGLGKLYDIHVSAAGQSNLIQHTITETMAFQVSGLAIWRCMVLWHVQCESVRWFDSLSSCVQFSMECQAILARTLASIRNTAMPMFHNI